ncbi:MAG: NAD-dependent epimerase/dehydratase family protein [Gemmatimonadales bacterium]
MIFLTGGTGLLGLALLEELRGAGLPCTALVRDGVGAAVVAARGATPVTGRVEDPATWDWVAGVSVIIHAAAILVSRDGWPAFERINVTGTHHAARRARILGVPLVHISSVAVYGSTTDLPDRSVAEDHPFAPLPPHNLYAQSKRMAEMAVREEANRGLQATTLRPCIIYGPGDRLFFPKLLAAARRGWLPLIGNGDRPVPLVHARNVAQAVRLAATTTAGRGHAYNVANDDEITAREIGAVLGEGLGRRIRMPRVPELAALRGAEWLDAIAGRCLPAGRTAGTLRTAVGYWRGGNPFDSDAARRDLGWRPTVRHRPALAELARAGG